MILGTGILLTFPTMEDVIPECFSQGYAILQKMATYQGPGVGGWYCE